MRQKADSFGQTLVWDAAQKDYSIIRTAQYDSYLTVEDLLIPGAEYAAGPEQRAYYGSWAQEYVTASQAENAFSNELVAEFSPLEDCMPDETVQIQITKVLSGKYGHGECGGLFLRPRKSGTGNALSG